MTVHGTSTLLWALLLVPTTGALVCLVLRSARLVLTLLCLDVLTVAAFALGAAGTVFARGPLESASGWLFLDALSAYHLSVMALVFTVSTLFSLRYFADEVRDGTFAGEHASRYGALWLGSLAAMILVLLSNHLGLMWVGIESTTLLTTFLICIHRSRASLEAMWKYLMICSVGIAFAFLGTLLVGAAASRLLPDHAMVWTRLRDVAGALDPKMVKIGFLFLLVGYGTKMGLAPMHTWLPDAHSQAPAPVSAIFSGTMLNTALYCLLRYVPLVEAATGRVGWSLRILLLLGLVSIAVAAAFVVFQRDVKRLLAYSSVEHLGVIAVGVGLGGLGTFAAMFHTLNHSLGKTLGFCCAGRLGQIYDTHEMSWMRGTLRRAPLWGAGLLMSLLVLIGVAPFSVFMSELQIVRAAVQGRAVVALIVFLLGTSVIFVGALGHATSMAWGKPHGDVRPEPVRLFEIALVAVPLAALLVLGLWMPAFLRSAIEQAASIVRSAR